ncbi:MAG: nuclear transport factor 2 family protein [Saprospiraceae bacterium]|nr:nuclear transport factor 2 family protein [Saprospiraceae bacterium]
MKSILFILLFAGGSVMMAQTPSTPTNPFPNNKKTSTPPATTPAPAPAPSTPAPTPIPPVNQQQIPPQPTKPTTVPPTSQSQTPAWPPTTQTQTPALPPIVGTDQEQIYLTIVRVFDAMRASDSMIAKPIFAPNCRLYTPLTNTYGQTTLSEETLSSFFKAIGTRRTQVVDERIVKYKIDIDGALAQVWADYNLYVDNKFIHCGVDVFQLYKSTSGWKIFELADTRRTSGCISDPKDDIAKFLDKWHYDAATSNAAAYFGAMTPDGVFLGTDATERWTRDEFRAWAQSTFDARKGWKFTASKRNVSFANEDTIAWFDEELATSMGPCRGSGVLVKTSDGWKIKQYNLTVLVPNEKLPDYLKLIGAR